MDTVVPPSTTRYFDPENLPKIENCRKREAVCAPPKPQKPEPPKNENNSNNLLSQLTLDITNTMKFTPPSEPDEFSAAEIPSEAPINPNHQKRTISQESTDSGESGISTDNSQSEVENLKTNQSEVENFKKSILKKPILKLNPPMPPQRCTRKDSGLSSDGEEENIIIIRRSRKRIPLVVKD